MNDINQLIEEIKSISYIIEDETFSFYQKRIKLDVLVELEPDYTYYILNVILSPPEDENISYVNYKRFLQKIVKSISYREYFDRIKEICESFKFGCNGTDITFEHGSKSIIIIGFARVKENLKIIKEYSQFVRMSL